MELRPPVTIQNVPAIIVQNYSVPIQKKTASFNHKSFLIIKCLRKATMTRSRLKSSLNETRSETRSETNKSKCKKQIIVCVSLLYKTKRERERERERNSVIWMSKMYPTRNVLENCKVFFFENGLNTNFTILTEKSKIITNDREILNVMNNYFTEIIEH